jgi:hypothetical protein
VKMSLKYATVCLVLSLAGALVPVVRADTIDEELAKKGHALMTALQSRSFKNVGVLKFEVQRGDKGPIFMQLGRLNGAMAVRLENVLILAGDPDDPKIGIVCGVGDIIAARDKKATYQTPAGRAGLFKLDLDYPLAWGTQKVKIDAFLTGRLQFAPDMETATVQIKAFHCDAPDQLIDLIKPFPIKTTVSLLSDMDLNFATRGAVKPKRFDPKEDEEPPVKSALKSILPQEPLSNAAVPVAGPPMPPKRDDKLVPPLFAQDVIEFEVFYDGNKAPRVNNKVPTPLAGQKVHFEIKNKTRERIGLVVRVNGVNTVDGNADDKEARYHACWVLEPDMPYIIRGIYKWDAEAKQMQLLPFTAQDMTPDDSVPGLFVASKVGKIELDLMLKSNRESDKNVASLSQSANSSPEKPATLADLQRLTRKNQEKALAVTATANRALITPDLAKAQKIDLQAVQFVGSHEGHVTITYFEVPKKKTE